MPDILYSKPVLETENQWRGSSGVKSSTISFKVFALCVFVFAVFLLSLMITVEDQRVVNLEEFTNVKSIIHPRGADNWSPTEEDLKNKIVLAVIVCSKGGNTEPRNEAAIMIKSAIISSLMYGTSEDNSTSPYSSQWWLEIHLFLEHNEDVEYFYEQLVQYGYPFEDLWVDLHFHSAKATIPNQFPQVMANDTEFRCMYVRDFIPDALPDVDSILYVDTDIIFTGNLMTVWDYRLQMTGEQLIAVAPDVADDNPMNSLFFDGIPIPPPKGLNSGVLLMNLTRMRATTWNSRILQIYHDYSGIAKRMNDQMLLNILLYYDSGLLLRMPCHYNFWSMHCYTGYYCADALEDPLGIQVIHGASSTFLPGRPFHHIFSQYEAFKFPKDKSVNSNFTRDLMLPIRQAYRDVRLTNYSQQEIGRRNHAQCDGTIDKLLFKKFFPVT